MAAGTPGAAPFDPGLAPPQGVFMNRNSRFPGRDAGENKFLDTLNGIVVLICIITPRHAFRAQEEL